MSNLNKSAEQIKKALSKYLKKAYTAISKQYANMLNEIRSALANLYEKYEMDGKLTYLEMAKFDRLKKFISFANDLLKNGYKAIKKVIHDILGESYLEGYYRTAWAIETDSLSKLKYSAVPLATIIAMIENPISGLTLSERLEKNRANIIYTLQQEITQGLVKGETYGTMTKRIKDSLESDAKKSIRIVRTEAHRVIESSKHDSAEHAHKNGVIMMKEWNSVGDERVRPGRGLGKKDSKLGADHRFLNGQKIFVHQNFKGKLGSGPAPGMLSHPSEDINCRCFLTYSVERIEKPDTKDLKGMTFETWMKERLAA